MSLNLVRQTGIIPDSKLVSTKVNIMGVGAIGSNLAAQISRQGMLRVTLWDFDQVESHNLPNQAFSLEDVGKNKAEAMAERVLHDTGLKYDTKGKWDGEYIDGSVVFSCVDNMGVRKQLLESMTHGLFIEVRMGVKHGQIYTVNPSIDAEVEFWMDNWLPDEALKEEVSACGTSLTIGSTAQLLSSLASWQCIHHMNEQPLQRRITACVEPYLIMGE